MYKIMFIMEWELITSHTFKILNLIFIKDIRSYLIFKILKINFCFHKKRMKEDKIQIQPYNLFFVNFGA